MAPRQAPNTLHAVTSIDVAKKAKVSQTTVSRVFRGENNVKPETINKVMEAAKQLGYAPNAIARGLTSRKTGIIALVSVNSTHSFYTGMVNLILQRCSAINQQVLYFQTGFEQNIKTIFQRILQYQVDGLILVSASTTYEIDEACRKANLPVVVIARSTFSPSAFSVSTDNIDAGRSVAEFLLSKGYRRFGFIGSVRLQDVVQARRAGFFETLESNGINDIIEVQGDFTYASGQQAMHNLWHQSTAQRAVFSTNDLMAMGAMDTARHELSLAIPQDIAFVGFDGITEGGWQAYNLTTVQQPVPAMVDAAIDYLARRIADVPVKGGLQLFGCSILERGSA